jgi:dephospho-CoA kinase
MAVKQPTGEFTVARGRPRESAAIAELVTRLSGGSHTLTQDDVMAAFGEKAFMLLQMSGKNVGVAGWQVENLVARTTEFFIDPAVPAEKGLKTLIDEVERASGDLQCEASILYLPANLAAMQATWKQLGYEPRSSQSLGVQAWTDAAIESSQPNAQLFFKQLRQDRVLRPI